MSTGWQVFCLFVIVAALAIAPLIAKAQLAKRRRKEDEKEVKWLKAARLAEIKALKDFESALAALERKATAEKRNLAERRAIRRAAPVDRTAPVDSSGVNVVVRSDAYMPPPAHNYGYGHHAEASPDSFSGGGGHFGGGGSSASYSSESSPSDSGGGDSGGGDGGGGGGD